MLAIVVLLLKLPYCGQVDVSVVHAQRRSQPKNYIAACGIRIAAFKTGAPDVKVFVDYVVPRDRCAVIYSRNPCFIIWF